MPIDIYPGKRNLIDKLVEYRQVIDVPNSVTIIDTFLEVTKKLIDMRKTGIYNVVNDGSITHKRILEIYKEIVDPSYELPEFIGLEELRNLTLAGRSNCILLVDKLKREGIEVENINEAMIHCLAEYRKYIMK